LQIRFKNANPGTAAPRFTALR